MKKFTTLTFVCFAVMLILAVLPANAIKQVSSFESHGPLENATEKGIGHIFSYTANDLPMFYLDLDEVDFDPATHGERLNLTLGPKDVDELDENGIVYESYAWEDVRGRTNIAWLGDKYLAVGEDVTKLSKYLVDFESDEKLTLRQGETWDLGEGFTIYVQDVDIEGRKVWMVMEQDGSPIADIIAQDDEYGYYNETVAGESDVEVAVIHVDKVFAGMTANMAVIDDAEVISLDVIELDEDEYFGMEFNELSTPDGLQLIEKDGSTSISRGKTKELIKDFISIRVGDTESHEAVRYYVYNEVQVGEVVGPRPTAVETPTVTETETEVVPTEGVTGVPTATVTETETEVPTQKPTKEPGFTAVFAVAGLLAVAYLVLRKRE